MGKDAWFAEQTRMRQRRDAKGEKLIGGAPFIALISGAHEAEAERVLIQYPGGERKVRSLHPYMGRQSWIRVGAESGGSVIAAQRGDSLEPELLAYTNQNPEDGIGVYKAQQGLMRPIQVGEIEIASIGGAQTYWSERPLLEQRAGLIRSWLDQDITESGQKSPIHTRQLHLHQVDKIGDEERFGVVSRPDGPLPFNRQYITADRAPDPEMVAAFVIKATEGILAEPGPFAKEYTRVLKSGALFPEVLVDHREGDVIDDRGTPVNLTTSGKPLRYKTELFMDSILGGVFFVGVDNEGNFSVTLPSEASVGGDLQIPDGDLYVSIGKSYNSTVGVDYTLSTADGVMTFDSFGDFSLTVQDGSIIFKPSVQFDVGTADEPALLGNQMLDFLGQLVDFCAQHIHIGNMGAPTPLDPSFIANFNKLKADFVTSKTLVSDYINFSKAP